jgi:hypothetical protein
MTRLIAFDAFDTIVHFNGVDSPHGVYKTLAKIANIPPQDLAKRKKYAMTQNKNR